MHPQARVVGDPYPVPIDEVKAAAFAGEEGWATLDKKYGGLVKPGALYHGCTKHKPVQRTPAEHTHSLDQNPIRARTLQCS